MLELSLPLDTKKCRVDMSCPTIDDIKDLVENMRHTDRLEIYGSTGCPPTDVLRDGLRVSKYAVTLKFNDEVAGIFGLRELTKEWGVPWALGTDVCYKHPHHFVSVSTGILRGMLKEYPQLVNMMDARNTPGLRWAALMGFQIMPPIPHGPFELPYHPIVLRAPAHV